MSFPIDISRYRPLALDPAWDALPPEVEAQLRDNVQVARDCIVFFTALSQSRGLGGHTGGAYDMVPEALLADGFMRVSPSLVPEFFDEAGHRVALQYLMSVLNGHLSVEHLLHYREAGWRLPGHPERGFTPGVTFSSGRLGHLWPYVNGIAARDPSRTVLLFGSDGSQQEGNDAEAARLAVARGLSVKLIIDDNDVTISGHPSQYLPGYDLRRTLEGHGLSVQSVDGEDLSALYAALRTMLRCSGPAALLCKRSMAPGIEGIEGTTKGHDAIAVPVALNYLSRRGQQAACRALEAATPVAKPGPLPGSSERKFSLRSTFGQALCEQLAALDASGRSKTLAIDSDLAGSCGLSHVADAFPDRYVAGGIMERGNFSAAAGFGSEPGYQGVFATFSAFLEMLVSEITMARLNESNVLAHFSHAGVADIVDNTCHFGVNNFFADGGLGPDDTTRLYFPADQHQMRALVRRVFGERGLRFVFSPRCSLPDILDDDGAPLYADGYAFDPGVDEVVRAGKDGWVVSYGDVLHQALGAVLALRSRGLHVGLMNKSTLNQVDERALSQVGQSRFVLVAESQNQGTGLGMRYGSWLLERGFSPRFARVGTSQRGQGGAADQIIQQGLDASSLEKSIVELAG